MQRSTASYGGNAVAPQRVKWSVLEPIRRLRLVLRQAERVARWSAAPSAWARPALAAADDGVTYAHPIYDRTVRIARLDPEADPRLEAGKRTNLALAAPYFDGLVVAPHAPLSFWRALGRTSRRRGFMEGMELRAGCVVPAIGGGLCLLSNALFDMALTLGWLILERHGHSLEAVPPTPGTLWGIDATVFWPHVDLRIAPREGDARLGVRIAHGALRLTVHARSPAAFTCKLQALDDRTYLRRAGVFRENRIVRDVIRRANGECIESTVVAHNRKRLLTRDQRGGCSTCGVHDCARRA